MKRLLIVGTVMLVAATAFAGGNPDVNAYIDFAPPGMVHSYMPAPYETFNAYRTKVGGCGTGAGLAKDRAAQCLTSVMIPEAPDYPV